LALFVAKTNIFVCVVGYYVPTWLCPTSWHGSVCL